jgi:hypothetical protein
MEQRFGDARTPNLRPLAFLQVHGDAEVPYCDGYLTRTRKQQESKSGERQRKKR